MGSQIVHHQPDGRAEWFTQANGVWNGDADSRLQLSQDSSGYTLSDQSGGIEHYNTTGRIVSRTEANGRTTTYGYDANQRLTSVTGPFGHSLQLAYDSANRIQNVTYPDGTASHYQYDTQGNLGQVTYHDTSSRVYHYEDPNHPHALTGITDENNVRFATWAYDSQGRANLSKHAGGAEQVNLTYNNDNSTDVVDSANTSRHYTFQDVLNVRKLTGLTQPNGLGTGTAARTLSYDANGNIASSTDFNGHLSCYAYDLTRNLETVRVEGLAAGSACPADLAAYTPATGSAERKIATQWHASYRLPTQIDEAGRRTAFVYDAGGNPLSKTQTDTATQQNRIWTYTYNSLGQILTEDGPRTDVSDITSYSYYTDTTATHHIGDPWKITNALGHVTTFTAYDGNGRLLSLTDPNGLEISFVYDPRGRLTQKTVDGHTTVYDYDAAGNLTQVTRPSGVFYSYTYDDAHRLTDIGDSVGNSVHYTLDAIGNRTGEDVKDAVGNVVKTHGRVFDALSRLRQDINAYNQATDYEYDANGNLTKATDANSHATQHQYDSLNRLIHTTDALAGATDYNYDAQDRLTDWQAPNQAATQYSHNGLGDRLGETGPDRGNLSYGYDAAGNLTSVTDARGITVGYTYDALNRRLTENYPDTTEDITYVYDNCPGSSYSVGRLCKMTDESGTTQYAYDRRGNLTGQQKTEAGTSFTLGYGYDADNRLTGITYPDGRQVGYQYDAAGRVGVIGTALAGQTVAVVQGIDYRADGLPTSLHYGNGLTETRDYDSEGRQNCRTLGSAATQCRQYDGNDNVLFDDAGNASYLYDELDRLSRQDSLGLVQNYGYDANGNRLSRIANGATDSYAYAPASNRPTQQVGVAIGVDAAGNITSDGAYSYQYNRRGLLYRVYQSGAVVANYSYNALGQRTLKTLSGGKTVYQYGPGGQLLAEIGKDAQGNWTAFDYVWRGERPVARFKTQVTAAGAASTQESLILHTDALGSPSDASNSQGNVVWRWTHEAFGATAPNQDPDGNGQATQLNLRFPGQYYDAETGLHYNVHRYYQPKTGRYMSSDPIGVLGGINTYTYVENNPLRWIDPFGLDSSDPEPGLQGFYPEMALPVFRVLRLPAMLAKQNQPTEQCPNYSIKENFAKKIFGDREGHLPDTPANRQLLENVANDQATTLGPDKFGNQWSAKTLEDGTQVWTQTRDGNIINGGLNESPIQYSPETGLSSPIRPNWK